MSNVGVMFVESTNVKLRDTIPMVGSAMMSASSFMFIAVGLLTVVHAARTGTFTWIHGLALLLAGFVVVAAGIAGAYPR